ncbi:type VII secretion protein [Streptomyces javensis]|uniref:Type VII secretion protein n=1 Tax=Streptomyces javensis TaxID=114698 RepID=A0ABS0RTC2_9ACTN|nr:type VII secretion protein [Streptomyces javensis]MBI0320109.1 type VII secretion protein [Streptomyces javensis]
MRDSRRPEARPQHLPAPTPVPPVDPRLALAQGRLRSGDPVTRRAGRTLRRLVAASASREVEEATEVARSVQQPVTTGRQIAVSSMRGGAGKTTVAALLNLTFAHYRQDPVLVVEADPALGSLPIRLGAESVRWTCADVARIVTPSMQFAEVTGYLVQLPEGGWLLPGSQGRIGTPLDIRAYRTVTMALRRYFGVTVVDCETLPGELARTALDTVQARVLVAPATLEGVASTRTVLDWMAAVPRPMLPGTVVALTQSSPDTALDLDAARAHLAESGVEVMAIPYDRHLAAGGAIRTGLLAHSTRLAAGRLAAALLDRAVRDRGGRR